MVINMSFQWDLSKIVDKKYAHLPPSEILKLPVHAIKGVSEKDAELLKNSLGVKTVGDLADNKFVSIARAITILAPFWEKALDKEFEGKSPIELVDAPVYALSGITPERQKLLEEALNIKTIRDLALNKYIVIALAIKALAELEEILKSLKEES